MAPAEHSTQTLCEPIEHGWSLHGLNHLHGPITSTGYETEPYELDVTTEPEQDDQNRSEREKSQSGIWFFKNIIMIKKIEYFKLIIRDTYDKERKVAI